VDLLVYREMALASDDKYTMNFLFERLFPVWGTIGYRRVKERLSVCVLASQEWGIVELCVLNPQLNLSTMNIISIEN